MNITLREVPLSIALKKNRLLPFNVMHAAIYSKIIKGSVKNSEFYITISLEELHIYTSIFIKKKEHVQTDSVFITHIRTK